ncbi:MAG TPA: aromatic amino acid hydroxylase [Oscillatoriaceae cyanobacterium]
MVAIPAHLRPFIVEQHYDRYTPIDQAVWRYIMRQNLHHLEGTAHPSYVDGLRNSGITVDRIPDVDEMTRCLSRYGWAAVVVDGIIPTTVFMDFQAHGLLPISAEIRSHEHIAYTPAPDIVHETAGHAPILWDERYSRFVKRFGEIGARALSNREDHEVYEATRLVSILKEDPAATPERIREAEADLQAKVAAVHDASEATLAGRLYWWTVEYGLIGDLERPRLYGAGLLSSVGESLYCLTDAVRKIPFSLEACIRTPFDITTYQPQLFVCRDFDELVAAVEELRSRMSFVIGGTTGLDRALRSARTATLALSSGLQWTGLVQALRHVAGEAVWVETEGPHQFSLDEHELPGFGREDSPARIASPIGRLADGTAPERLNPEQRRALGLVPGEDASLRYASGIEVRGRVVRLEQADSGLLFAELVNARVTHGDAVLWAEPGPYFLLFGARVDSVWAGAADKERFFADVYQPSPNRTIQRVFTPREHRLNAIYADVRDAREQPSPNPAERLADLAAALADYPEEWLPRLQLLELARKVAPELAMRLRAELDAIATDPERGPLIANGLKVLEATACSQA